jgi:hypothetical protein
MQYKAKAPKTLIDRALQVNSRGDMLEMKKLATKHEQTITG